jgi:hypothetical protein
MQLPPAVSKFSLFFAFCTLILIAVLKVPAAAANQLTFNPTGLRFGEVVVGRTETLAATMTNNGSSSITVSTMSVNATGYTVNRLALPLTLAPGQTANFTVTFSPAATGTDSGDVAFNGNIAYLKVRGSGVPGNSLTANPPSVGFGNVQTGSSGTALVTLTNAKNTSITISQEVTTGSGFAVNGLALPVTLAAGHSFTFGIAFSPSSTGPVSGQFEALNSGNAVLIGIPLTGTGVLPQQHSVSLLWNASTSEVAGYNVYRHSTSSGPYSKINSTLDTSTTYTDSTVASGQTYYYVTTAVNSSGQESLYSNQAEAVIP